MDGCCALHCYKALWVKSCEWQLKQYADGGGEKQGSSPVRSLITSYSTEIETVRENQKCHKQHGRDGWKSARVDNFLCPEKRERGSRKKANKTIRFTANCVVVAATRAFRYSIFGFSVSFSPKLSETQIRFRIKFVHTQHSSSSIKKTGEIE